RHRVLCRPRRKSDASRRRGDRTLSDEADDPVVERLFVRGRSVRRGFVWVDRTLSVHGRGALRDDSGVARDANRPGRIAALRIDVASAASSLRPRDLRTARTRRSNRHILSAVLQEGNAVALAGIAFGLVVTRLTAGWLDAFIIEDDQYNAP